MALAFARPVARSLAGAGFLTVACTQPKAAPENPLATLSAGWNRIAGPHGTGCSHDSSYAFYVKPGASDQLTIYFQGGGACWNGGTCGLNGQPTFDPAVDSTDAPGNFNGILDVANPANPLKDHSIVYVPYCTADVFLGNRSVGCTRPAGGAGRGKGNGAWDLAGGWRDGMEASDWRKGADRLAGQGQPRDGGPWRRQTAVEV